MATHAGATLPTTQFALPRFLDVTGDGLCTARDALLVINYIERTKTAVPEGEADAIWSSPVVNAAAVADVPPSATTEPPAFETTGLPANGGANVEARTQPMAVPVKSEETAHCGRSADLLEWDDSFLAELQDTAWGADAVQ